MARVARLRIHPVKALDAVEVEAAGLTPGGGLSGDREFALFGPEGHPINGKRTDQVHGLRTDYDPEAGVLTVAEGEDGEAARFDLRDEPARAEAWFADYFEQPVTLRRDPDGGFPDRPGAGPSVVSTATVEAVASWFDALTVDGVRRRLRANVEVAGVPAFWEDRFVGDGAPTFVVRTANGSPDVHFEGDEPCGRCVVPTRDPDTGEATPEFRERFIERRGSHVPRLRRP